MNSQTTCLEETAKMKFRTEVHFPESNLKIEPSHKIFSIGSCFATEIAAKLNSGQLQTLTNPFGTLFNPYSVNTALRRIYNAQNYTEQDLVKYDDEFLSLDHHTSFTSAFAHQTLERINTNIQLSNQFLQETDYAVITYGSSYVYEFLPKNRLVSNCHKIPQKFFNKRLLSHLELTDAIAESIQILKDISSKNIQILVTVSPVRHSKDGFAENQLSKSKLITAIHEVLPTFENCTYLPVYEVMMDDLRDYRFYREDLIHPSAQAVQYIFEKFGAAWFSEATKNFIVENMKIKQALEHRPKNAKSPKYQQFLEDIQQKISVQQQKVRHKIF